MEVSQKRFELHLSINDYERLKEIKAETGKTMTRLIRSSVKQFIANYNNSKSDNLS